MTADRLAEMFLRCDCCTHALHVEKDEWGWNFAVWEWYPYGGQLDWKQRLRYVWQVIRRGKPYGEHVILKDADARRLGLRLLGAPEGAVMWMNESSTSGNFKLEA